MRLALLPGLALLLLATACQDNDRGGLGPRGTALPPPEPGPEEPAPPPQPTPARARPVAARPAPPPAN